MLLLRIEFLSLGGGRGQLGGQIGAAEWRPIGAATIDVAAGGGPVAVPSASGHVFAQLSSSGGAVFAAVGSPPNLGAEPRFLVRSDRPRLLRVEGGLSIGAAAATDVPGQEASGGAVSAASPVLTAGLPAPISLNTRGALRVVPQNPDGTDRDPTTPQVVTAGPGGALSVTIASGQSLSPAIDLGDRARLCRIAMPAGWDAADLTVQTSFDGATWNDLYDAAGTVYAVKVAASRAVLLPVADWIGVRWLKLRSGTPTTAVAQTAARALTLVTAAS